MEDTSTESIRAIAHKWSLAGDEKLLHLLQKTHENIITKCQDVNVKLEEMASALNTASINLQNVNNKFMSLSNSQFIESRVYDDDDDLNAETAPPKEEAEAPPGEELSRLKESLRVLELSHEHAEIADGSDSDSDMEISVVLKPKDMYAHRPLPYIIGSHQWKNKWHAGLVVEDSDTDSSGSKRDREADQYSDTDSEETRPPLEDNTLSESGSSLGGSLGAPVLAPSALAPAPEAPRSAPPAAPAPADIAAALARRLALPAHTIIEKDPEEYPETPPPQTVRKTYKPEVPATSTIFSDEPPPLDNEEPQSSDDDIFAEINKHTPYSQKKPVHSNVTEDLFSFDKQNVEEGDIFSDFAPGNVQTEAAKQKSALFEGDSEPELFAEPPPKKVVEQNAMNTGRDESSSKKPVGGISLFGSSKGAESIGAAILKRNQRKSSTSDEDSQSDNFTNQTNSITKPIVQNKPKDVTRKNEDAENMIENSTADKTDTKLTAKKEKDIFEDLFSKPDNIQKKPLKTTKPSIKSSEESVNNSVKEKEKTNVKDLFSDNIFDDIDDIFTSNIKIPSKESNNSNQKSLFDDDDLFSDIGITKTSPVIKDNKTNIKNDQVSIKDKKTIFDSDDELFSDVKKDNTSESYNTKVADKHIDNKNKSIKEPTETNKERNSFEDSPQTSKVISKAQIKNKSIFDSDSDSDDIFAKVQHSEHNKANKSHDIQKLNAESKNLTEGKLSNTTNTKNLLTTDNAPPTEKSIIQSPSLFEEDEIDDLFITATKIKSPTIDQKIVEKTDNNCSKTKVLSDIIPETPDNQTVSKKVSDSPLSETEQLKNVSQEQSLKDETTIDKVLKDDLFQPKYIPSDKNVVNVDVIESSQDIIKTDPSKICVRASDPVSQFEVSKNIQEQNTLTSSGSVIAAHVELNESGLVDIAEKETVKVEQKAVIPSASIFDNMLAEPPAFQKQAEPKKSRNVNALFDDDSDDESLFFKKNDGISDEKPEIFSSNANFDIFVNEPPAIDVDFTTKSTKNSVTTRDEYHVSDTENLSVTKSTVEVENLFSPETNKQNVPQIFENRVQNDLFKVPRSTDNASDKILCNEDDDLFSDVPKIEDNEPGGKIRQVTEDKEVKTTQSSIFDDLADEDLFAPEKILETKTESKGLNIDSDVAKINIVAKDSDEELFASLPSLPQGNVKNKLNDNLVSNLSNEKTNKGIMKPQESPKKESDTKKIGKLNTKKFNINVNALIPGASPKKVIKESSEDQKSVDAPKIIKVMSDEVDFKPKSTTKIESIVTDQEEVNTESEKAKSVTFDEKSESGVLDNNVSKQRARIQVKRRPSSRRARHEAARKSAIDFGDDTDNSSSLDEPRSKTNTTKSRHPKGESTKITSDTNKTLSNDNITNKNSFESNIDAVTSNKNLDNTKPDKITHEGKDVTYTERKSDTKPTTTKVVYILNDEDIFNTDSKKDLTESRKDNESKNLLNNDADDIFKSKSGNATLGNTYKDTLESSEITKTEESFTKELVKTTEKEIKTKQDKKCLFDDSDEELFSKKKDVKKKTTIFESDSEDELFSGNKNKEKNNKQQKNKEEKEKKGVVKKSLFSDNEDDDDLFGLKKDNKNEFKQKPVPSTSHEVSAASTASKSAEPVFSDPLSMFGNDD